MEAEILVKRAQKGDKEALIALITAEKKAYYQLAYALMKNQEDALDAMEEMILILYEQIPRLKTPGSFYSWSKTILANCCKRLLKQKSRLIPMEKIEEMGEIHHEGGFKQQEDKLLLESHLAKLNHKQQEVLKLRYFLEMDYEAISQLLKIPLGTVKSRIHTGLVQLKKGMEAYGNEGH